LGRERINRTTNPEVFMQKNYGYVGFLSFSGEQGQLHWRAHVAQLVEHVLGKDEVIGSIPIMGSRRFGK
jgi:hypothetical protein